MQITVDNSLKREQRILSIVAFAALLFVFATFSFENIKDFNYTTSKGQNKLERLANNQQIFTFSACGGIDYRIALFHFFTFFIFLSILKTRKFLLSSFLTFFYAVVFIYGLSAKFKAARLGGEEFSPRVDFFDQVFRAAGSFDYIISFFILILLFWQISILLRILIKTLQRKSELP